MTTSTKQAAPVGLRQVPLLLAAVLFVLGNPRPSLGENASQATLTMTSQRGDTLGPGDGKTLTYSTPQYTFVGFDSPFPATESVPNHINVAITRALAGATNPGAGLDLLSPNFHILGDTGAPTIRTPFFPGVYVCAKDIISWGDSAHVPSAYGSTVGTTCLSVTGTFTINSIAVTSTQDSGGNKTFQLVSLDVQFTLQCTTATGKLIGHLIFHSAPIAGAVAYDPIAAGAQSDFGTCPDGTTGSGTPGGGSGSGSGGGPIPTAPTIVLPDNVLTSTIQMPNSGSASVSFSTFIPTTTTSDVTLTATTDADNLLATITPSVIKPGDTGDARVTIQTTAATSAGEHIVTLTASDGTVSSSVSIHVTVICDPPFILGIDQPKSTTVALGRPANLSVKASGSGPLTYQWFSGAKGLVNFPLAIGSSPNFTTSAINDTTSYWVRVTNPCGSVDSQTVTVSVAASAKPASNRR